MTWFGARCVFRDEDLGVSEERVTLRRAAGLDAAITLAEQEAAEYAEDTGMRFTGLTQAFAMDGSPGEGAEVFSLMRTSALADDDYLVRYFDTGAERTGLTP